MKKQYNTPRTLHITDGDRKFIPALIEFFKEYFDYSKHDFIVLSRFPERKIDGLKYFCTKNKKTPLEFEKLISIYDKIVIHGLLDFYLVRCLLKIDFDFSRVYWLLWGGDVYCYLNEKGPLRRIYRNFIRKSLISKLQHAGSFIQGAVAKATVYYKFSGQYHECMAYVSNTLNLDLNKTADESKDSKWTVLVGNSGYENNSHAEIFDNLNKINSKTPIKVICPLAYGNQIYIKKTVNLGKEIFGNEFLPILDYLELDNYYALLESVDSAIFAHDREQGTGNAIPLLGLGKKVFFRRSTTQWETFKKLGIKIYDYKNLSTEPIPPKDKKNNINIVKSYFSEENLARQYYQMLGGVNEKQSNLADSI